jgi:hypothetical protein
MRRGIPLVRFAAKVATQSVTAVLATLLGGYFLTVLHLRAPEQPANSDEAATADRALTREYVKSLREGSREEVAEVRPTAPSHANETTVGKTAALENTAADEAVSRPVAPPARKESRIRPEAGAPQAPPLGAPVVLAPVVVTVADPVPAPAPTPQRSPTVFSVISSLIGTAANATGDSINFVIDLPGRALGRIKPSSQVETPQRDARPAAAPTTTRQYAGS